MEFRRLLLTGIVLSALFFKASGQAVPVRFFNSPLVKEKAVRLSEFTEDFGDSTASDVLYQHLAEDNIPVSYFREIETSVCFDGKCRLLDIMVHWNPVGGYMGFELPEGEFLSKTDHDPFTHAEYLKLHTILSDSLSPLADYTFEELVPGTGNPNEVDAVSSATLKDLLEYIVPGAAYTTYRLWHLVYGKTTEVVSGLSDQLFSEKFALALLGAGQPSGQMWALNRLERLPDWNEELTAKVLTLAESKNLNVAAAAIAGISGNALNKPAVQAGLLKQVAEGEYALRKTAIRKLNESARLDSSVVSGLTGLIPGLNGDLLGEVLNLFLDKRITDHATLRKVSEVLESNNRYTAGKAFGFLEKVDPADALVKKRMKAYKEKR